MHQQELTICSENKLHFGIISKLGPENVLCCDKKNSNTELFVYMVNFLVLPDTPACYEDFCETPKVSFN